MQKNFERHPRGARQGHPLHDGNQWASGREGRSERDDDDRDEHRFGGGAYRSGDQRFDRGGYGAGGHDDRGAYGGSDQQRGSGYGYDRGGFGGSGHRGEHDRGEDIRYGRGGYGGTYDRGGYDGGHERGGYTPADYRSYDHGRGYGHDEDRRTFNPDENDRYGRSGPDRGIGGSRDDHHGYARDQYREDRSVNAGGGRGGYGGGYDRGERPAMGYGGNDDRGYSQRGSYADREQQRSQQSYGRGDYGRDDMRPFGREFDGGFDRGDYDRQPGRRRY